MRGSRPRTFSARTSSVSRTTLRQALGRLEQEGLDLPPEGAGHLRRRAAGRAPGCCSPPTGSSRRSSAGWVARSAPSVRRHRAWAAAGLGLRLAGAAAGQLRGDLERIRSIDGLKAMYVINCLPERPRRRGRVARGCRIASTGRLRERCGLRAAGGRRVVEAMPAEVASRELLEVEPERPLMLIESVTWDDSGGPFDCYQTLDAHRSTEDRDRGGRGTAAARLRSKRRKGSAPRGRDSARPRAGRMPTSSRRRSRILAAPRRPSCR